MSDSEEPHADDWLRRSRRTSGSGRRSSSSSARKRAFRARRSRARPSHALKRAAGMALNGALIVRPDERWGRSYVEHLRALNESEEAPAEVREAARRLSDARAPAGPVVTLRTRRTKTSARGGAHGDGARLRHRARLARQERKTGE